MKRAMHAAVDNTSCKMLLARGMVRLREQRGWTQTDLATRSGIGTNKISLYERGITGVTSDTIDRIAAGFEVSVTELLSAEE